MPGRKFERARADIGFPDPTAARLRVGCNGHASVLPYDLQSAMVTLSPTKRTAGPTANTSTSRQGRGGWKRCNVFSGNSLVAVFLMGIARKEHCFQ